MTLLKRYSTTFASHETQLCSLPTINHQLAVRLLPAGFQGRLHFFPHLLRVLFRSKEVLGTAAVRLRLLLCPRPVNPTPMAEGILGASFLQRHRPIRQSQRRNFTGGAGVWYCMEWCTMYEDTGRTCGLLWWSWHLGLVAMPQRSVGPRRRLKQCPVSSVRPRYEYWDSSDLLTSCRPPPLSAGVYPKDDCTPLVCP